MEPVIRVRNLNHFYGSGELRKQVLYDLCTDIYPGEIVILTGPSGSGKTTFLTLAGALRSVGEGSLTILGQELKGANPRDLVRLRENIGFIFQAHNLIDSLTACQNVQMSFGPLPVTRREAREKSLAMLSGVGLEKFADSLPAHLSGGQKQRVAIARALVRRPKIVLADEPTASLDRKSGREVVEILQGLAEAQGCTILMVTHDNRILDIADRILTLEDGCLSSLTAGLAANTGHMLTAFAQLYRKGELVRHMKALSGKQFLESLEQITSEFEQFLHTVDLGNREAVGALFDQVLEAVTLKIRELLRADRGTIFIVDHQRGRLRSKIAHTEGTEALLIDIPITAGIAGRVATTGSTLNVADPYNHPDFNPQVDRETGYRTHSLLCMPIFDRSKRVVAVAQMLNKQGNEPFSEEDEKRFREFTDPLGVILESCARMSEGYRNPEFATSRETPGRNA